MSTEPAPFSSINPSADPNPGTPSTTQTEDVNGALATRGAHELPQSTPPSIVAVDSPMAGLPMQLDVTVPIPFFRVENLVTLEKGAVLESHWHHADDVPLWCGGAQLAWTEFEVVDRKLAVRLTRIS